MKQTARVNNDAVRAVNPCIRNAEVGCSSHLRGTMFSLNNSANSERALAACSQHYATFAGTNHDFHKPL